MTEYISHNLEETKEVARKVLDTGARVIGLTGDLGAGKTALTKCIAELLGIEETVTSPTYVIMKKYTVSPLTERKHWKSMVHIDAYRLTSYKELEVLEFKKELHNPDQLIIIEWSELVKEALPADMLTIRCDFIDEMTRKYSF